MAVATDNDRSVEATVSADIAVTTALEGHAAPQLAYIDAGEGLPQQGTQSINLYLGTAKRAPLEAIADALRQGFAAVQTPTSGPRHIIGLSS